MGERTARRPRPTGRPKAGPRRAREDMYAQGGLTVLTPFILLWINGPWAGPRRAMEDMYAQGRITVLAPFILLLWINDAGRRSYYVAGQGGPKPPNLPRCRAGALAGSAGRR